jgi:branched-chain amino acid transport system substrate-binding protein
VRRSAAGLAAATLTLALLAAGCGGGPRSIRIGVLAVCQGDFAPVYEDVLAGAELPLLEHGGRLVSPQPSDGVAGAHVAGRGIDLVLGCSDDSGTRALWEARRLVEQEHVDVLVGPETSAAGIALRDYARTKPHVAFLLAIAPAVEPTLQRPAPNVFRFTTDAVQWTAGLGAYAYRTLGWRRAVVIGNDFYYPYAEAAGFISEFCALGGDVVKRVYGDPPVGIPHANVDGYFLSEFIAHYLIPAVKALGIKGGLAHKVVLGAAAVGAAGQGALGAPSIGVVGGSAGPAGSSLSAWTQYLAEFRKAYPELPFQGYSPYYFIPMQAALAAIEAVHGDLSPGEMRLRAALTSLHFDSPTGPVRLNGHRQAVAPNYVVQVVRSGSGGLTLRTIGTVENVDDSYAGRFSPSQPTPSRTYPRCTHGNPPRWARSG